ncbi:MAG: D-alanine--D-alanine ligase [Nitrospiraceae bacterium]|nr:D-alanine--D-alanine ligase [Nitrospiraceae bacterium]
MSKKDKIQLALLCGGRSAEREISLAGAKEIERALDPNRYCIRRYDPATDLNRLINDAPELDVAFVLLHGRYGEDGTIQGLLDLIDLPYQCSGVLGSALAMDKHLAKVIYREAGISTPPWIYLPCRDRIDPEKVIDILGLPIMVKPCTQGSSVGMSKVITRDGLRPAIEEACKWDTKVLLESFIEGREITGGVLGTGELLPLPIVEIIPDRKYQFFDYRAKYLPGASREICPADIPERLTKEAQILAVKAHEALQLRAYSRTDMILTSNGGLFVLETNTIPGMTQTSLFPQAAKAAGISFSELLDRLIDMALS